MPLEHADTSESKIAVNASVGASVSASADTSGETSAETSGETSAEVTDEQAKEAVRTLLLWLGEDPDREGLADTPRRYLDAWKEYFSGYGLEPEDVLTTTFQQYGKYQGQILVRNVSFLSHCEHHIAPIRGFISLAYIPRDRVVGLSKIARLCQVYAKRLQLQEQLTDQIGRAVMSYLEPAGVAVHIRASHSCMSERGVAAHGSETTTLRFFGDYRQSEELRKEFTEAVRS